MTDRSWISTLCLAMLVSACVAGVGWSPELAAQGLTPTDGLEVPTNLSMDEMITRAKGDINVMKGVRAKVLETLEDTRKNEKDLVKLDCVNSKFSTIKGFLKVSEQSFKKLEKASDKKNAQHQFALISLASSKVQNQGVEAQACAGEVLRYTGDTEVNPDIDEDIAENDSTNIVNETEILFRFPEATPYQ